MQLIFKDIICKTIQSLVQPFFQSSSSPVFYCCTDITQYETIVLLLWHRFWKLITGITTRFIYAWRMHDKWFFVCHSWRILLHCFLYQDSAININIFTILLPINFPQGSMGPNVPGPHFDMLDLNDTGLICSSVC